MNLLYFRYAVEVARAGSVNKAAEKLYLDQPNLSRAIKELEASLGVTLFERSTRGMKPTPEGELFLQYAESILKQVDTVEHLFEAKTPQKQRFSLSAPRATYISDAFTAFSKQLDAYPMVEAFYKETNSMRTIKNLTDDEYKLGIVRYAHQYDSYYKEMLSEKGFYNELVTEFHYLLLVSCQSPLARKEQVTFADLENEIEIAHADPYVPSLPLAEVKKTELPDSKRRIFVFERGSQFEVLSSNPKTFMWVSPIPQKMLDRYGLVQKICVENRKIYKDVMIYRKEYKLTDLDKAFISELCRVKREVFCDV